MVGSGKRRGRGQRGQRGGSLVFARQNHTCANLTGKGEGHHRDLKWIPNKGTIVLFLLLLLLLLLHRSRRGALMGARRYKGSSLRGGARR